MTGRPVPITGGAWRWSAPIAGEDRSWIVPDRQQDRCLNQVMPLQETAGKLPIKISGPRFRGQMRVALISCHPRWLSS